MGMLVVLKIGRGGGVYLYDVGGFSWVMEDGGWAAWRRWGGSVCAAVQLWRSLVHIGHAAPRIQHSWCRIGRTVPGAGWGGVAEVGQEAVRPMGVWWVMGGRERVYGWREGCEM